MPDASEPVELPIHCALCHGAVTLQISEWPAQSAEPRPAEGVLVAFSDYQRKQKWSCPYCGRENEGGFPGRVQLVTRREVTCPAIFGPAEA